jgi:hypothetical protein
VALAKLLVKFAQDLPLLKIKGGIIGGQTLTAQEVDALSKLPAREVLLAQLLGLLQAPTQSLVNVLSGVIRNFLNVLVAIRDQKEGGEAPAEATATEGGEAPAEPGAAESGEALAEAGAAEGEETPAVAAAAESEKAPAAAAATEGGEAPAEAAAGEPKEEQE